MAALVWFAAALVLVGVEALSGELVLLMLAGGALAASGSALFFETPIVVDGVVFAVVSVLLLIAVRPVARRHFMRGPVVATNADALQGKTAVVTAEVTSRGGQVLLGGDTWSARAFDDADVFETGQDVMVMSIDGATAVVRKG